jgi:hypothetical protein
VGRGPALTQNRKAIKAANFINGIEKKKGKGKTLAPLIQQTNLRWLKIPLVLRVMSFIQSRQ